MHRGIAIASSRQVDDHRRQLNGRSIFSPAPISATITPISVRWVVELRVGQRVRCRQPDRQQEHQHAEGEEGDRHGQRALLQHPRQDAGEQGAQAHQRERHIYRLHGTTLRPHPRGAGRW